MTGQTPICVLFCANAAYFQHLAVAALSLSINNPTATLEVHVMTSGQGLINGEQMRKLRATLAPQANLSLEFHTVEETRLAGLFVDGHLARECYLRFLAAEVLDFNRVLYLDCDLVVLESVAQLWATDLRGKSTAAAPDFVWDRDGAGGTHLRSLGLNDPGGYVNSGVLLMDLDRWRTENISARLFDLVRKHGTALSFHDQDALNILLEGDIHLLDPKWNLQARMYRLNRRTFPHEFAATRLARQSPAILHFTTANKPWAFRSRCPHKGWYLHYLRRTAWADQRPGLKTIFHRAEYALDRFFAQTLGDYMVLADLAERAASKMRGQVQ